MRCETCHGSGKLTMPLNGTPAIYPQLPCRECQGSGFAFCCEGERPCPEVGADGHDSEPPR